MKGEEVRGRMKKRKRGNEIIRSNERKKEKKIWRREKRERRG